MAARRHFQMHFFNENVYILITISLKFVPKGPINNISALVQIMIWCRAGDKPLSGPTMISYTDPAWLSLTNERKFVD